MELEAVQPQSLRFRSLFRSDATQRLLAFGGLIILIIVFTLTSPRIESEVYTGPAFLRSTNIVGILLATSVNGVLAFGVTFVIISGGIDLSIGTVMTFSAVMTAVYITQWQVPVLLGAIMGILTGGIAGVVNGVIIAKMKIPPFISTLGMMYIAKGLSLVIAQLKPMYFNDYRDFTQIAMGTTLRFNQNFEIPNAVLILFGAALVGGFILSRTALGRYTFALGSNEEATRLSGVKVDTWKIAVYTLCGLFAGLGGVVIAARLNSAQPALGQGYELDAIAAAVIGGTSLSGGEGTIIGTVIGAFLLSVLTNGLRILSVPQEWQTVVTGAIVILAVYLDILRRRGTR